MLGTIEQKLQLGFAIVLGTVVIITLTSFQVAARRNEMSQWILHTQQVQERLEQTRERLQQAEAFEREMLSRNPFSIDEQDKDFASINEGITEIERLTQDDLKQRLPVAQLRRCIGRREADMRNIALLMKVGHFDQAYHSYMQRDAVSMNATRKMLNDLAADQNRSMQNRVEALNTFALHTDRIYLALRGFMLLCLAIVSIGIRSASRAKQKLLEERTRSKEALERTNGSLEAQIQLVNEQAAQLETQKRVLEAMNLSLETLATTDGLTGMKNHRAFQERLADEMKRTWRYHQPMSLILLDVDRFKRYNDTFGHPEGDKVLKIVAQVLKETARASDFLARYGGEEFVIILPNTDVQGAVEAAERFRSAIEQYPWALRVVTASFGTATLHDALQTAQGLVDAADRALYASKAAGRNQVVHADLMSEKAHDCGSQS